MSLFPRSLLAPFKRQMDPAWVRKVEHRYDTKGGYRAHLDRCRDHCPEVQVDATAPIVRTGYEHLCAASEATAAELERTLLEGFATRSGPEKSPHLSYFDIDDRDFERRLLEEILTPSVEEKIMAFFGSEYFVYRCSAGISVPVANLGFNSFRWHCDRGPHSHLKLTFYLNGWEEHGGGTAFLDLETTRRISASGYVFAPVRTRVADLGPIARKHGAGYAPWFQKMKAGEAILFQPARVLHKGQLPTLAPRHVVTVALLPSPIPWREVYMRQVIESNTTDGKWHESASQFSDALFAATQ